MVQKRVSVKVFVKVSVKVFVKCSFRGIQRFDSALFLVGLLDGPLVYLA